MENINITEIEADPMAIINRVLNGEEFIIEKMGVPVAKIVVMGQRDVRPRIGAFQGQGYIAEDFDSWGDEEKKALGIID